ncbi:UNVERIFIED_CONTAM: hypothetical protein PYX00_011537 [Menopon gallinae]|uniref:Integrase catalytic domain-containing protein n=1 Tax=Menopon gallinae TaxID=328185 RepID=A0AAW2H7Y0_9NEOP
MEFCGKDFARWCLERGIRHRRVEVELHQSNGRVERAIGTLRKGLAKNRVGTLKEWVKRVVGAYNNTLHTAIGCTTREAWEEARDDVQLENSSLGNCEDIEPREPGSHGKGDEREVLKTGEVVKGFEGDSYLVCDDAERQVKKRHYDLKGVAE